MNSFNKNNEESPAVKIVANGDNLALIAYRHPRYDRQADLPVAIWYYNPDINTMQLTYKASEHQ